MEEVFRSKVIMSMQRPLSYHQIRLARTKKPSGKDWRAPNNGGLKYDIRVPRNAKDATQFDQIDGNKIWADAILNEL